MSELAVITLQRYSIGISMAFSAVRAPFEFLQGHPLFSPFTWSIFIALLYSDEFRNMEMKQRVFAVEHIRESKSRYGARTGIEVS